MMHRVVCACVHTCEMIKTEYLAMQHLRHLSFLIKHFLIFLITCRCVAAGICPPTAGSLGNQNKVSDFLELKLQAVMSCPMRMLGTKRRSFARTVLALNHSLSPAPTSQFSVAGTFEIHSSRNFEIWITVLSSL